MKSNTTTYIIIFCLLLGYAIGHIVGCYHERTTFAGKAVKVGNRVADSILNRLK